MIWWWWWDDDDYDDDGDGDDDDDDVDDDDSQAAMEILYDFEVRECISNFTTLYNGCNYVSMLGSK